MRVYLASRSPRRRELLRQIGAHFELLLLREHPGRGEDVDETPAPGEAPADYVLRVACAKAEAGWQRLMQRRIPRFPVLTADTTVAVDSEIIGKPRDARDAAEILRRLSGRSHEVFTAVALAYDEHVESRLSASSVRFRPLSEDDIRRYVASGEPMDKAGAYGIQGRAAAFAAEISGSYSGIMGLPLFETAELLRRFGMIIP
jgi:septum formation protein